MGRLVPLVLFVLALPHLAFATPITIDFEAFGDGEAIGVQIAGVTFSNAIALQSGVSLNELELPPKSGANVAFESGGPFQVDFLTPVVSVSGYFTYLAPITLAVFDSSSNLLGSVTSAFGTNLALSGDPGSSPNELLTLAVAGISRVTVSGTFEGSFVLDDFTYDPDSQAVTPVPEPGTLGLVVFGSLGVWRREFLRRHSTQQTK